MILDEIAAKTRERVERSKQKISLEEMKARAESMCISAGTAGICAGTADEGAGAAGICAGTADEGAGAADTGSGTVDEGAGAAGTGSGMPGAKSAGEDGRFPFERALRSPGISFICEVKKASPSKGLIAEDFDYLSIAREYEAAGASAISVLTEPDYFLGSIDYLREISGTVSIPLLRKDFTVDEYMIYEAKVNGASLVLLICALLDAATLERYIGICDRLGLSALVEAHDEGEIQMAVRAGARIIGVNNRNLKDFTVDIHNGIRLREKVPEDILFVAESGIATREDVVELERGRVNAALIGETLMRSADKKAMLDRLRGSLHTVHM